MNSSPRYDTVWTDARLATMAPGCPGLGVIEDVAVTAHCSACGHAFTVEGWHIACPACGADAVDVLTGRELHIDSFAGVREAEEGASG